MREFLKIPLRLKCSSPHGGAAANDSGPWRWPAALHGGGEGLGFGGGERGEMGPKMASRRPEFTISRRPCSLKRANRPLTRLSELKFA